MEIKVDDGNARMKITNCDKLEKVDFDTLMNVSLLEIMIYSNSEKIEYNKKVVVQFVKENEIYKNIILS